MNGYWTRRVGRRQGLRAGVLGGAGLAAAFALACGGGGGRGAGSGSSAPAGGGAAPAGQQQAAEQPKSGGIINQRIPTDPAPNLDLHQTTTYTGVWPVAPAFNQLIQFDPDKPKGSPQDIIADLAEKWEQPDSTTLVFPLRKDAKWHDGTPFTAEDAKATLEWIKKPPQGKPSPRSGTQLVADAYEVVDPATFRVKLSRPSPSYLMNLASHYFAMAQAKDLAANGEVGKDGKLIGTGPFKLKNYQRSNFLEMEEPCLPCRDRPYLDGLKFFVLPSDETAITNFIAGQYQMIYGNVQKSDLDRFKSELGDKVETAEVPSYTRDVVFMNASRKPYDDIRVRRAISLACDRDAAIKVIRQGGAQRIGYMSPAGVWAIPDVELRKFDGYDKPNIEQAKQLLAAAGVTTPLEASATTRTDFKDLGEYVKDQLAKIGINVKLTLADTATAQPVLIRGDFDIGPWTVSINIDDPDATFSEIALSVGKAARNWSRVNDQRIDDLYDKQSVILDFNERKKVVEDLEKQALSAYQIAALEVYNLNFGRYKTVRNFVFHQSLYTNRRMEAAWLKT
ncbi:MAG: ABC transporter substrate-binding protein [Dehalococcoidia bacterium]